MKGSLYAGRFLRLLTTVEGAIAVTGLSATAISLLLDIITRELFKYSFIGTLRIAVYGMAISALFGFCVCIAHSAHIRVTVMDNVAPARWRPTITRLGDLVSFLICVFFAVVAAQYVSTTYSFGERDDSLGMLVWPIQIALPWIFVSGAVRYGLFVVYPSIRAEEREEATAS